jgi:uncharacterized RDD family membrane protein YckC
MENKNENYAGFWIRFVAFLIDSVIINTIMWVLIFPLLGAIGMSFATLEELENLDQLDIDAVLPIVLSVIPAITIVNLLITWLYYALLQSGPRQATVGKMAIGVIVIDADGGRMSFARASLRYFSKIISSAIMMIGYIMAGFTAKKQALHDIIANTYVVKKEIT